MKLDPRHLEILAAIVDAGGLTEGAALLGKSQPSVSRSMALLEARIGTPLFESKRRPLQATKIGLELAQEGARILSASQAAARKIDLYRSGKSGDVRIAGTPIFMDGVVSGFIAEFQSLFPEVRIDQSYGYASDLFRRIEDKSVDLAILPSRRSDVPGSCIYKEILEGQNVVACRVGHPLTRHPDPQLSELTQYPWIAPPANSPLFHDMRNALEGNDMNELKISFTGGSLSAVLNILLGSDALTVLPKSVVSMQGRTSQIKTLPVSLGRGERNLGLVWLRAAMPSAAMVHFRTFLEQRFNDWSVRFTAS